MRHERDTMKTIIVTRHAGLLPVLVEKCGLPADTPVIAHANEEDVRGGHVYGVLPLRLAAIAGSVTEVTLEIPADMRGKELDEKQVREYYRGTATYSVRQEHAPHTSAAYADAQAAFETALAEKAVAEKKMFSHPANSAAQAALYQVESGRTDEGEARFYWARGAIKHPLADEWLALNASFKAAQQRVAAAKAACEAAAW